MWVYKIQNSISYLFRKNYLFKYDLAYVPAWDCGIWYIGHEKKSENKNEMQK